VTSAGGENFGGKRAEKKKLAAKSHRTRSRAKFESTFQKINKPLLARRERERRDEFAQVDPWMERERDPQAPGRGHVLRREDGHLDLPVRPNTIKITPKSKN
jgi:hypothetical protein